MNFLAHSLLGFDDSGLIAGQFCGDFVRGSDLSRFPARVEKGIRLHRYLDRFTDTHSALALHRQEITVLPQRFAGILVDVLFDHYLALNWNKLCKQSIEIHAQKVHSALQQHQSVFPDSLKRFMRVLQSEQILQNNVHLSSIVLTLHRLSKRSEHFSVLALAERQLEPVLLQLTPVFDNFYPELEQAALHYINEHPAPESCL